MADILQKKEWDTKQVVAILVVAISLTFSATMIWSRFLSGETKHEILSKRVENKDDRINTKVDELELRVKNLEQPNSDK